MLHPSFIPRQRSAYIHVTPILYPCNAQPIFRLHPACTSAAPSILRHDTVCLFTWVTQEALCKLLGFW